MEKITEKIAALPPDSNYFSLEFFPPKTQMVGFTPTNPGEIYKLTYHVWIGLGESTSSSRTYGSGFAAAFRDCDMGCRGNDGSKVS
jgi:hypothetical protein